jgi:hypothetical protein
VTESFPNGRDGAAVGSKIFGAISFRYPASVLYLFPDTGTLARAQTGQRSRKARKREKDFFVWIRRNPLKRPDSAKGIQGNPSLFPWFSLDLFAFIWRKYRAIYVEF